MKKQTKKRKAWRSFFRGFYLTALTVAVVAVVLIGSTVAKMHTEQIGYGGRPTSTGEAAGIARLLEQIESLL